MDYLDIAHSFIEGGLHGASITRLTEAFASTLEQLGFRYFACGSHVDPLHPERAVMVLNYPSEYVEQFSGHAWHRIDPVFLWADQSPIPFSWDAPGFLQRLTPAQRAVLNEAQRFGLSHGYTIPIHAPGYAGLARASCSIVPDSRALPRDAYAVVQLIACYVFQAAWNQLQAATALPEAPSLSPRECECLELAALGKDQWSIGRLLNISEHTAHAHIESARRRLGASSTAHAIAIALASGQIRFGDLHPPIRKRPTQEPTAPESRIQIAASNDNSPN